MSNGDNGVMSNGYVFGASNLTKELKETEQ